MEQQQQAGKKRHLSEEFKVEFICSHIKMIVRHFPLPQKRLQLSFVFFHIRLDPASLEFKVDDCLINLILHFRMHLSYVLNKTKQKNEHFFLPFC